MTDFNIVFLDADSVAKVDFSCLESLGKVHYFNSKQTIPKELYESAHVFITNKVELNNQQFSLAQQLKLICVAATGYNNIDLISAKKRKIAVSNVAGYSSSAVAQHAFAMLLSWANKMNLQQQLSQNGTWQNSDLFCLLEPTTFELKGKTLGIIGYGDIAKELEKVALAFGMEILIAERQDTSSENIRSNREAFEQVLNKADIISLHCPLTKETEQLVDHGFIKKMKKDAILINTARGGLINEEALAQALNNKVIQAALLDGLSKEPPCANNPLLKKRDNLVLTSHTAWASQEARQRLIEEIALNIKAFKQGEQRNRVDQT